MHLLLVPKKMVLDLQQAAKLAGSEKVKRLLFVQHAPIASVNCYSQGTWKGTSAGGCFAYPSWKNNPQYLFDMAQASSVTIRLAQHAASKNTIGFYVVKGYRMPWLLVVVLLTELQNLAIAR